MAELRLKPSSGHAHFTVLRNGPHSPSTDSQSPHLILRQPLSATPQGSLPLQPPERDCSTLCSYTFTQPWPWQPQQRLQKEWGWGKVERGFLSPKLVLHLARNDSLDPTFSPPTSSQENPTSCHQEPPCNTSSLLSFDHSHKPD